MNFMRVVVEGSRCYIISDSYVRNVETVENLGKEFERDFPSSSKSLPEIYEVRKGAFDGYVLIAFRLIDLIEGSKDNKEIIKEKVLKDYFPLDSIGGKLI